MSREPKICEWRRDEDDGSWDGDCGVKWILEEGTLRENEINFCPRCGGKLKEVRKRRRHEK